MTYSSYITDELSTSLGKMAEKEIDEAVRQHKAYWMDDTPFPRRIQEFLHKASSVIPRLRPPRAIIVVFWFWTQNLPQRHCYDLAPSLSYSVAPPTL